MSRRPRVFSVVEGGAGGAANEAAPQFAELCARTSFSFLEGASHPEEMVKRAQELGLSAIAIADRDGLYGVARAHGEAKKSGQKIIIGAELSLEAGPDKQANLRKNGSVVLLAQDHDGYSNLCRLLTKAHTDHEKGSAGIGVEEIASASRGLVAIFPLMSRLHVADEIFGPLRDAFGPDAYLAAWRHLDRTDNARQDAVLLASTRYGMDVVATARPLYHNAGRKPLSDVLACIRHKTTLDQAGTLLSPNAEALLRTPASMKHLFRDNPDWVTRTVEIAEQCRFSLSEIRYHFPSEGLCLPEETPDDALRRLVMLGVKDRYPEGCPNAVMAQIQKELELIRLLDVAPYFLSVHQIVSIARRRRILCQGRGSAANSAVCFVLGITAVDPARSSLLFERFLSPERREPPDIDVDFEHERREEVIQEIYEMYGRDRAAMVSEVICYRGKSALREVGKVFGLTNDQLDKLSGMSLYHEAEVSEKKLVELGFDPGDTRLRTVVMLARSLEGMPRHLSIHVGGFVLSAEPLHHVAPIEPARMVGRSVIPWDKDDIDDLGFFKVDILALGMLTAVRKTLALMHERTRPGQAFDPIDALARIPAEDPAVYEAIGRADTVGVFQIESRAQMSMLPRLKPKKFYDLVIEVAIVRPGPIQGGMVHPYLRRRMGQEAAISPHPCLDSILDRTLGVPLFQEQVMQIAMVGAGYTPGEADQLRRDMAAWKKHGRLEKHRDRLLQGFSKKGISARFSEQLFAQIQGFGEYGFPESHAASFALLVYASAYLKVHYPAAFCCAILNSQPMGFYSPSSLVQDAQRHGVEVRPVCVTVSTWDHTLEEDGALRLGMRLVKGFGAGPAVAIEEARADAPFTGVADLVRRAGLHKNEVEALAEAGALEALVTNRREALWRARAPRVDGLFEALPIEPEQDVGLPKLRPAEQLVLDYGRLGLSLQDHPMRHYRARLDLQNTLTAEGTKTVNHGSTVRVAGLVIGRQRPATASGVTFFTLEDETGVVNIIVRKTLFDENYAVARYSKIMAVVGRLEKQGPIIHILAEKLERLDAPGKRGVGTKSRDFH
jgi:error-prone DNA polymerase